MKAKRLMSILLAVVMLVSVLVTPASAVEAAANTGSANVGAHYFYDQLTDGAKQIYSALYQMYQNGDLAKGTVTCDLVKAGAVTQATVDAYAKGDTQLFADFAAAKDAFVLDLSEVWYLDSSYLCLCLGMDSSGKYVATIGPRTKATYLIPGLAPADVAAMDGKVQAIVNEIVSGANDLNATGSETDQIAKKVRYVHEQVTKRISYRFENECADGNSPYVRTLYALVTHEGVCEAYARAMQVILTKLNIPCVLVHGLQNSGTPEMHMWNEVQIGGKWYAVDATWDDPVKYDKDGKLIDSDVEGNDGREHETYLLVGMQTVGQDWLPSGKVSSGPVEFTYPRLEASGYAGEEVYASDTGLHVSYTSMAEMEGASAGQFKVDFNGKGAQRSADEDGLYLLIKMHDLHNDGTIHQMEDWYYAAAAMFLTGDSAGDFFHDEDDGLYIATPTCEYVEFAMTNRAPDHYEEYSTLEEWGKNAVANTNGEAGFYHGDASEIYAQTEMLYNAESNYEAAPYVKTQTPAANQMQTAGYDYHVQVTWDDTLYHPTTAEDVGPIKGAEEAAAAAELPEDDRPTVAGQKIRVLYTTYQLDKNGEPQVSTLSVQPEWDANNDHYVDDVTYQFDTAHCPNHKEGGTCSLEAGCPILGVSFDFRASDMWADDLTLYQFQLEGVVGSRSYRKPNIFEFTCSVPGLCPACYRSQGIDWNLWGMPTLLDNPNDLDLSQITMQGVDGSEQSLADLQKDMKVDDLNGRLTLVVEPLTKDQGVASREKYEEVDGALQENADQLGLDPSGIQASSMYEITFTRICKMVMLKTGQSLRLQMGFPQGCDPENCVFKAYHFTRNDAGEIVSVEEIPVAVTPYGLVVLCDSFSPFEIVALNPDSVTTPDEKVQEHTVVVNTEGSGKVTVGDTAAVGKDGFIQFAPGESKEFTITPEAGYAVDTVAFGGQTIAVTNNRLVLTYDEVAKAGTNAVLAVSYVPVSVKEEQEISGMTVVIPNATETVCEHKIEKTIPAVEPTCEKDGQTEGVKCANCDEWLKEPTVVAKLGHDYKDGKCTRCGAVDPNATYTLTIAKTTHGTVQADAATFKNGQKVTLTVQPADGYTLDALTVKTQDGKILDVAASGATYTFTGTAANVTVTATFKELPVYTVTIAKTTHGTVQADTATFKNGQKVTLTVQPAEGYTLDALTVKTSDGKVLDVAVSGTTYTFTGAAANVTVTATFKELPVELPFTDLTNDWYMDAVKYAYRHHFIEGYPGNLFKPDTNITRGQIVTMLWRLEGSTKVSGNPFTDVKAGAWYADAVNWAQSKGIVTGYGNGKFGPNTEITREQLATILYRYAQYKGYDTAGRGNLAKFKDGGKASSWAVTGLQWSVSAGLIEGMDATTLAPKGTATRAQAATMMMRLCEQYME